MIKKLLKFYVFGLLVLLLFIPSFSKAELNLGYSPFMLTNQGGQQQYIEIGENLSFTTTDSNNTVNNILYIRSSVNSNGVHPVVFAFGWKNGQLYGFYNFFMDQSYDGLSKGTTVQGQGYLKYYALCQNGPCNVFTFTPDFVNNFIKNNRFVGLAVENGATSGQSYNGILGNIAYPKTFCFMVDSLETPYLCFSYGRSSNRYTLYDNSLNYNISDWNDISSWDGFFDNSPFSSVPSLPDYSVGSGRQLRNYEVLIGFEYMGLSKEYCYGGFDLNNIFLPSEQFSDFSGYSFGTGATIFNLYNAYGGGLGMKPFLSTYYQSFLNSQLSNFHNKSKALLMLFQQYQSANDRGWGSFKLNDLMDYCDLYFNLKNNNRENDGDIYTGNNQNAINSYKLNTKIPEGGFTNTGVLATGTQFTGFSSADEFFGRLTNLFQSNVNGVEDTFPPIIPSYIVAFMLAIILIRIISH